MRALILTDIHGNLTALEQVLDTPEARSCDRILSLGDQVNFGPQPREVLQLLRRLDAVCLMGNHEERLFHIGEPAFAGYSWQLLHWTWAQVKDLPLDFGDELRLGPVLLTHAVPGDHWRLIHEPEVPAVLDELPDGVRYLISGHNHCRWSVSHNGRLGVNPGSLGVMESGWSGMAPFAVLEMSGTDVQITLHQTAYRLNDTARAFIDGGSAQAAPEMTRAVFTTMRTGEPMFVTKLVRHVMACGDGALEATWKQADATHSWPEAMTSEAFWKETERDLHG